MKKKIAYILFCLLTINISAQTSRYKSVHRTIGLMGSQFDITVIALDEELGYIYIEEAIAEISRIEKLISSWEEGSETALINRNAGIKPVKVSDELFRLVERAIQISELTDGAFDISYASKDEIWKFDGSMKNIPSATEIKNSVAKVGYSKIILDRKNRTVFLKQKGMKISFGALGKGYAADKAKEFLISKQVKGGVINASGDLSTWGTKVNGDKWLVGIKNPSDKNKIFSWLPIVESSVATSGNYEKYVTFDGVKYSHIIDPRTGYPTSSVKSASVFAKSAEMSDALATAIYIMGKDSGIFLINQLDGVEAILIDSKNKIHKSSGIIFDRIP